MDISYMAMPCLANIFAKRMLRALTFCPNQCLQQYRF